MSILGLTAESAHTFENEMEYLTKKLNAIYLRETENSRLVKHDKDGISLEYAIVDSEELEFLKADTTIGFGAVFPTETQPPEYRVMVFRDAIDPRFLEIGLAHLYFHLKERQDGKKRNFKRNLEFELAFAEKRGVKEEYLRWMEENDPNRYTIMRGHGLVE